MGLGAGLGVVMGVVLAVSQPALAEYSIDQIIGFLALLFGAAGLGLGAVVALLLDRSLSKRSRVVEAQRTTVETVEPAE